jgi:uncharacterized protein involved in exopolysaccharide biosynthesis
VPDGRTNSSAKGEGPPASLASAKSGLHGGERARLLLRVAQVSRATHTSSVEAPDANHDNDELDLERVKQLLGFFLRGPRRRPVVSALVFLLTVGVGAAVAAFWPRSYGGSARILAQHNLVLPALDNPNRQVPRETDSPTKNAADTIMRRDNVIALVKQLDLVDRWQATRQPILRLKDRVSLAVSGPRGEQDRLLDLIGLVEKRLVVGTDDSSINISVEWPDREVAFEIVSLVMKNFLEASYDTDVKVIAEAIHILEVRAKPEADEVDAALQDLSKLEALRRAQISMLTAPRASRSRRAHVVAVASSPSHSTLGASIRAASPPGDANDDPALQLEEVRHRIREAGDERQRRIDETQNQLAEARATLGPLHPTVLGLNGKLAELSAPPEEVLTLRTRERDLLTHVAKGGARHSSERSGRDSESALAETRAAAGAGAGNDALVALADTRDDPSTAMARSKLQAASMKYNELLSRIESANIELEVTRASFKYQYTVVRPPELARSPSKPNLALVILAFSVLSLLLMIFLPGSIDLLRGRFVEHWQMERALGLPLLAEL